MPRKTKLTPRGREMRRVIRALDASGMTVRAYAEAEGHSESVLWHWRRRLRELDTEAEVPTPFVPVTVIPDAPPTDQVTVELRGGRRIHVAPDLDERALRRLITAIESC